MRKMAFLFLVLGVALFVFPLKGWAPGIPIILIEKAVSLDGGVTWFDADTEAEAPVQTSCNGVKYRLIITTGNTLWDLTDVTVTDNALGIDKATIGDLTAANPEIIVTSEYSDDFKNLDQPLRCEVPGLKDNMATVTATPLHAPPYTWEDITASDAAYVLCQDVCDNFASLGDRVWQDLNGNGIQDCTDTNNNGIIGDAGDVGPECAAGTPNVTVFLEDCNSGNVLNSTQTDGSGFYLFDGLPAGSYCVRFDLSTVPADLCGADLPQFTTQNAGGDDALDSDADPDTGLAPAVDLAAGETNRTVDAGILCQECSLSIDKKCLVVPQPPEGFVCSDAKPIDSLTMVWGGSEDIRIKAWKGSVGSTLLADVNNIAGGQEVTVSGYAGSPNDVYWEIFDAVTDAKIGESTFHVSCSDDDMNGPEDCGKSEGDGKDKAGFINTWIFEGMAGNGLALDCTPAVTSPSDQCEFEALPLPTCATFGKPTSLTFRYTGSDCSASQNSQAADKWDCSGEPGSAPVGITIIKDPTKITVSPSSGIVSGDLVTVYAIGRDMGSEIQLNVGGQYLKIHTSCSQPLAAGDVFGSLALLQFNGRVPGAEVTYLYEVKNNGNTGVDVTSVLDDKLGELLESPVQLLPGESTTIEKTASILETTTNKVTATANLYATAIPCGEAWDEVTVKVVQPTCEVAIVFDKLEKEDKIKWKVTNTGKIIATLDTFTLNFPPEYGTIKEVKLDGAIFKKDDSSVYPNGVPPGAPIGESDWTNPDVAKRTLDPGETRTLEVVFTQKSKGEGWVDIDFAGTAVFAEGCAISLPKPPDCKIGKPTALKFQYTGEGCVDGNSQASDKWSCNGDPAGAEPVQIVMIQDADKFFVDPGSIGLGETFEIRKIDGGDFPSEIKFDIRKDGQTLQSLKIHTSCSQPLSVDDQFGSVILTEFYPKL